MDIALALHWGLSANLSPQHMEADSTLLRSNKQHTYLWEFRLTSGYRCGKHSPVIARIGWYAVADAVT
jgi:hypothetical protein